MRGYRVLLFGSDSISCATLDRLRAAPPSLVRALEVVTPPDRPRGRDRELGSVLLKLEAQRYGLAVHHPWQGAAFRLEANDVRRVAARRKRSLLAHARIHSRPSAPAPSLAIGAAAN
jgi:methionyl-tRNA formyltransferase